MNDIMTLREQIKPGDVYEHYKGMRYRIIGLSCHSEDLSWSVVYQTLYENNVSSVWHRPVEIFFSTFQVEGKEVARFARVEPVD